MVVHQVHVDWHKQGCLLLGISERRATPQNPLIALSPAPIIHLVSCYEESLV